MEIVVDTSIIVAVLVGEAHRAALIKATRASELLAPPSVHWEVGNAFSAMFKRRRLTLREAQQALQAYSQIPIRYSDVELGRALVLAEHFGLYAYDAYVIVCAEKHRCSLLSLDRGLLSAARRAGVKVLEVES